MAMGMEEKGNSTGYIKKGLSFIVNIKFVFLCFCVIENISDIEKTIDGQNVRKEQ